MVFVTRLLYSYKNVKKYICLKVLIKVKISLEGFIFPFLSYLTIFTPQCHFFLFFLVSLGLVVAFNKEDNLSCVKGTLSGARSSQKILTALFLQDGTNQQSDSRNQKGKSNSKRTARAVFSGLFNLSTVYI